MIKICFSRDAFLYDAHSLVKAFFQEEEVGTAVCDDFEKTKNEIEKNEITSTLYSINKNDLTITIYQYNNNDITFLIKLRGPDSAEDSASARVNASTDGSAESALTEKNALKQLLYKALCAVTGRTLPWGALTGIRPTKIATQMLADNKDDNTIKNYLKTVHFVSDEKADVSVEIARRERGILAARDYENGYSLYVGIPFCPTRCSYCSFAAYPLRAEKPPGQGQADGSRPASFAVSQKRAKTGGGATAYAALTEPYLGALRTELTETAKIMQGVRLDTVYIGGGTPTTLTAAQSAHLLSFLQNTFDFSHVEEFTVEAGRPDSILDDTEKLRVLKEYGVNRVCVNPQTFSQRTLDLIGRRHTVRETVEAFYAAREAGFDNINMDIILGLPGETADDVAHTMEEIAKLMPDDLTIHSLAVKRGSRIQTERQEAGAVSPDSGKTGGLRRKETASAFSGESETGSLRNSSVEPAANGETGAGIMPSMYREMARIAEDGARAMGLLPYYLYRQKNMTGNMENTGYAREGKWGLTNILGMEEVHSIVACGAGAVTKRVWNEPAGHPRHGLIRRCGNVRELDQYITRIDEMITRKRRLFNRTGET